MQKFSRLDELITNFSERYRIGLMEPDKNMHYRFYIDGHEIRCFSSHQDVYILIEMARIDKNNVSVTRQLLRELLQNALIGCEQSSCTLALNEQGILCLFQRSKLDDCDLSLFEDLTNDLVSHAGLFLEILTNSGSSATTEAYY